MTCLPGRTCAVSQSEAQFVPTKEKGRPGKVERQLNGVNGERDVLLLPASLMVDQPWGCAHQGIQDWPDNAEDLPRRLPVRLPQVLIPAARSTSLRGMLKLNLDLRNVGALVHNDLGFQIGTQAAPQGAAMWPGCKLVVLTSLSHYSAGFCLTRWSQLAGLQLKRPARTEASLAQIYRRAGDSDYVQLQTQGRHACRIAGASRHSSSSYQRRRVSHAFLCFALLY